MPDDRPADQPADRPRGLPVGFRRGLGLVVLCSLIVVAVQVIAPRRSITLGPVTAITPDQVIPNGFVGYVFNPTVSGRGESATVHDAEVQDNGFVFLNAPGQEPMVDGLGMAVSGNGCTALWARPSGSTNTGSSVLIGVTDRCGGGERALLTTSGFYDNLNRLAVSFDGRFGVVLLSNLPLGSEFPSNQLVRVDTVTGETRSMALPGGYFDWSVVNGVDISDNGSLVVVPILGRFLDVALWNVNDGSVQVLTASNSLGSAAFPSISGDGRFVSFASGKPFVGSEVGTGPWVYVRDRSTGGNQIITAGRDAGYHTSISRDGSQVAFAVSPGGCRYDARLFQGIEFDCPTNRIDVAFTAVPGFASGFAVETTSLDVTGGITGQHLEPDLSGNGRWVTWVSDSYGALLGVASQEDGRRHAFIRRRDASLTVDGIDFGTIPAGSSTVRTTTARNTGRSSVYVDQITLDPGRFTTEGGTCTIGLSIPPGGSCTIDVRYAAPGNTATTTGTIRIGETGFDQVVALNGLRGASQAAAATTTTPTVPPIVTVAPTTTVTGQVVPTTSTTNPGSIALSATPNPVDYGGVPFQLPSTVETITVTNTGTAAGVLVTVLDGADPEDFWVNVNGCNTTLLAPGASCEMEVVLVASAPGQRSAVLTVSSGDAAVDIALRGNGTFVPQLIVTPAAVTMRGFTSIIGLGFPPNEPVTVSIGDGSTFSATPDAQGSFQSRFSPFGILELGNHLVTVAERAFVYEEVRTQMVVVLPTFQPQGPGGPAFGSSLIVTRGS